MGHLDYTTFVQRHRPHIHPIGAELFLTYRLAGTIPKETVRFYKAKGEWLRNEIQRCSARVSDSDEPLNQTECDRLEEFEGQWFLKFEEVLHKIQYGPNWLRRTDVAKVVADGLVDVWQNWPGNYLRKDLDIDH